MIERAGVPAARLRARMHDWIVVGAGQRGSRRRRSPSAARRRSCSNRATGSAPRGGTVATTGCACTRCGRSPPARPVDPARVRALGGATTSSATWRHMRAASGSSRASASPSSGSTGATAAGGWRPRRGPSGPGTSSSRPGTATVRGLRRGRVSRATRERLLHSVDYRSPGPYRGRDVLVVGTGNSGAEIAVDLVEGGAARVRLAVRTPPNIVRRERFGVPARVIGITLGRLPRRMLNPVGRTLRRLTIPDLQRLRLAGAAGRLHAGAPHGHDPHPRRGDRRGGALRRRRARAGGRGAGGRRRRARGQEPDRVRRRDRGDRLPTRSRAPRRPPRRPRRPRRPARPRGRDPPGRAGVALRGHRADAVRAARTAARDARAVAVAT